ncbi:uncharacterized protein LOC131844785 [Achroia grisella]|uniref:uncharacterized protein LOC131844785 n=1 Tax=Achroia grisella TaxID=688607 RepID=UPI0027D1FC58|nr:uncharacterized protein LOC131844785 [Achroia grisella]XP_059049731.1 uncharacterized protein LOC131844785 [Achroia grisella]XP_059049732.1 uncharacterized protein LOC131844785 [Achroia grisella]XP_059049733.1 uncharacterized protein LOC131844785 [Achroia grisella]
MDSVTSTDDLCIDTKTTQENILLEMIKELCCEANGKISSNLKGKVNRIIADCDLTHYSSLHRLSTADESTSTLLGYMQQTATDLTFEEQAELNQAIINKIQEKIPAFTSELDRLRQLTNKQSNKHKIKELQENLDEKLNLLQEQENEKVELMMEWLNHRLNEVTKFSDNSSELLTLKTQILDLKSKILHLQILQNIFTETNQSIKAYSEIHKDLQDSIKETEERIKKFRQIIASDI